MFVAVNGKKYRALAIIKKKKIANTEIREFLNIAVRV